MKATKKNIQEAVKSNAEFLRTLESQQEILTWAMSQFGMIKPSAFVKYNYDLDDALKCIGIKISELNAEVSLRNLIKYNVKVERWNSENAKQE